MTEPMISPDSQEPTYAVRAEAERCAAFTTSVVAGARSAAADLVADRADTLHVPARRRNVELSTTANRIRYGFLGEAARDALGDLQEEYERRDDTRDLDLDLVAAHEHVRQVLRLSATVDEPMPVVEADGFTSVNLWGLPCPACDAAGGLPCAGAQLGTVHVDRVLATLIAHDTFAPATVQVLTELQSAEGDTAPADVFGETSGAVQMRGQL